jgi:hypothetical protein
MKVRGKHFWYCVIVAAFLGELLLMAWHGLPTLPFYVWVMFPFAVLRMGRLLAYDGVMQPFRGWCVHQVPHYTGNGDTTEGCGDDGLRGAIGDLLSCPICSGTHAASLTLLLLTFFQPLGLALVYVTFGIGAAEMLNAMLEGYQWHGDNARRQAVAPQPGVTVGGWVVSSPTPANGHGHGHAPLSDAVLALGNKRYPQG